MCCSQRYAEPVRVRHAIAGIVALIWLFMLSVVAENWAWVLQLAGLTVGIVIFGAIAWPDDFRKNPPARRGGPPGA